MNLVNFIVTLYLAAMCTFVVPYMMSLNSELSTVSLIAGGIMWLICVVAFIKVGYITFYKKEEVVNPLM